MGWLARLLIGFDSSVWSQESVLKTGYNVPRCGRPYVEVDFSRSMRRQAAPSENVVTGTFDGEDDQVFERIVMRKSETINIKIFGRAEHNVDDVAERIELHVLRFGSANELRMANITPVRTDPVVTLPTLPNHEMELASVLPLVVHVEGFFDDQSGPGILNVEAGGELL